MLREGLLDRVVDHSRGLLGRRLIAIVLYGSLARAQAREDSDLDLFLLAETLPADPFERIESLPQPSLDPRIDPAVSLRALSAEEWARDIASLDLDIAIDGRVLYDRDRYAAERLALIRKRIDEAGLWRDANMFWRWKRWPSVADWNVSWDGVRT